MKIFPKPRFHANITPMAAGWLYLLFPALFAFLVIGPWGGVFSHPVWRIGLFLLLLGAGWLALKRALAAPGHLANAWLEASPGWAHSPAALVVLTALFYATLYKLAAFIPDVSTYPLSLGWSEVSRYYYASLYFAESIYGVQTPPSVLHPSRYLLQSIPFLIPGAAIWLHRLWQVLLWWGFSLAAAAILVNRLRLQGVLRLGTLLWVVLSLFQGPVYYHLLVMVILVVLTFDAHRPLRTAIIIVLASLWAGISRINWFPMPGLLAAALYLLSVPVGKMPLWRYLAAPAAWSVGGTLLAVLSERAYIFVSGNPAEQFGSSFSSDLLWYRLLPNPTYPLGVLPAALLAFGALSLFLLQFFLLHRPALHWLRWLGLAGILAVLFVGGVIVSVKIGGGSNLHNMDAFLVMLIVVAAFLFAERFQAEPNFDSQAERGRADAAGGLGRLQLLVGAACIAPIVFALASGGPIPQRDEAAAVAAVAAIRQAAQHASAQGEAVLFINQRHLLTFNQVQGVPLVPDYELVFLMEMTMSGNQPYLDVFHQLLQAQHFGLIVVEPLKVAYQGRSHNFGEENDAWVAQVSEPVLCYYEPAQDFEALGVVLMVPRQQPCR